MYVPDLDWGIAVFGNTESTSNSAATVLAYHLIDDLLGIPKEERFDFVAA